MKHDLHFRTLALKNTKQHFRNINPVSTPIYLSTTYVRNPDGSYQSGFQYSRTDNPNRLILEESLALLERGKRCFAFSSGMAAVSAIFQCLDSGDHILLPDDLYYNIYSLVRDVYHRWGLELTLVDMTRPNEVKAALKDNTKLIWVETPSNPLLKITDIKAIADIAKAHDAYLAVDNTFATPVLQNPIALGADIIMHSTTKYIGGHSDVVGGCIILKEDGETATRIAQIQELAGGVPSPFDCWLVARGLQTLYLRVTSQSTTALALASFLNAHTMIEHVFYPGLGDHPQHAIARGQMHEGFGGMLSVLIKGDEARAMDIANNLSLFASATSLGGSESLVEHRKSVEGPGSKTPGNLLRISVGLEHIDDLIADWEQALG